MRIAKILKLKKIRKAITSRSLWGSFLFAVALWGYTSLNSEYKAVIKAPLTIQLPPAYSIENPIPATIGIVVKGSGWHLFNYFVFKSPARCFIDLTHENFINDEFQIPRTDFIKGLQNLMSVEPLDVLVETAKLKIGLSKMKLVPIKSLISIIPRKGYTIVGDIEIDPDSVLITGNDKIIKNFKSWNTIPLNLNNISSNIEGNLALEENLSQIIKINPDEIKFKAKIELTSNITISDVYVIITGNKLPDNQIIYPRYISITFSGGVDEISKLSSDDIRTYLDYSEIVKDTTGILQPKIKFDEKIKILKIDPPYLYHRIRANSFN